MPLQRGEGEGQEKEGDQDQEKAGKRKNPDISRTQCIIYS